MIERAWKPISRKSQHIEQKHGRAPHSEAVDAHPWWGGEVGGTRDGHSEGDQAKNCREAQALGDNPRAEVANELKEVPAERTGGERHDIAYQLGEHDAQQYPARRRQPQTKRQFSVSPAMALERDGGGEQEQCCGVVQELSPFNTAIERRGMLTLLRMAVAAAASGGATIAPSASPA